MIRSSITRCRPNLPACLILCCCTTAALAKESPLSLPPAPRAVTSGQIDLFERTPHSAQNNRINIFYATPRLPTDDGDNYSKDFDDTLRLGSAALTIGPDDLDWDSLHAIATTAKRPEPKTKAEAHRWDLHLKRVAQAGQLAPGDSLTDLSPGVQNYIDQINSAIEQSAIKDLTIIVHGAFNSFDYAAAEAAQYRFYTGKQAVVIAYAWPAVENHLAYSRNVEHAERSEAGLNRLLKILGQHSDATRINIIGYSVGGRLTSGTIARLADEYSDQDLVRAGDALRLGHLYLASSDGPIDEARNYTPKFVQLFDVVTVTIAYDDPILGRAQLTGGGHRLGRPAKPSDKGGEDAPTEQQMQGIRTAMRNNDLHILNLEISDIPGYQFSHGAWYLNPWVSSDVFVSLNLGLPPAERGLASYMEDDLSYWYFPENYASTLHQALLLHKARRERHEAEAEPQAQ